MTGQELIEWIKAKKAENAQVEVAYRDEGGLYYGTDKETSPILLEAGQETIEAVRRYIRTVDYKRIIL